MNILLQNHRCFIANRPIWGIKIHFFHFNFSKFEKSDEQHHREQCEQYKTNCIGLLNSDFISLPVYI